MLRAGAREGGVSCLFGDSKTSGQWERVIPGDIEDKGSKGTFLKENIPRATIGPK